MPINQEQSTPLLRELKFCCECGISESFSTLSIRIDQLRFKLTDKVKLVNGDVQEIKESTEKAWEEISDLKSNKAENTHEVNTMKSKYEALQQEIQALMRKNNNLEQYTRKENLRLLSVPENMMKTVKRFGVLSERDGY